MSAVRCLAAVSVIALMAAVPAEAEAPKGLQKIDHVVVIYLENHSFDNLFGQFPGAEGLTKGAWAPQVDKSGQPYANLPPVMFTDAKPPIPDTRFPSKLVNAPFMIDQYLSQEDISPDLVHRFYQNQAQIDGGKNDKFAAYSDAAGMTMGFYDARNTKLWDYASRYTLSDHFFMGSFGGSFLNHMWLVCACTPRYDGAPEAITAKLDAQGNLVKDGAVTPDGFAVNTIYSVFQPHPASVADKAKLMPPIDLPNIGDRLSEKNISWAWYSGGWNDALAGHPDPTFQFHHQPLAYFSKYGDGTEGRKEHLKDEAEFVAAIQDGTLPAVSFYKPIGIENQHPGYANITNADLKAAKLIGEIEQGPQWKSTAIIVTYDENGGFWDHVAPPKGDRWGPGTRVPTNVISPYARRHYIDHTVYDTTSILKLIERRWGLAPFGQRDAKANDMTKAFDFK